MRRKWISTLLMLTIGVGLLSGCGKAADNNTTTEVTDATSNGEDGTVTLEEFRWLCHLTVKRGDCL